MFLKIKHVHFIGIGGIGMSGLAELLHTLGFSVSGSDAAESENTLHLRAVAPNVNGEHISVTIGHHPDNIFNGRQRGPAAQEESSLNGRQRGSAAARPGLQGTLGTRCDVVVYSSAIRPDNPELVAARNSTTVAGTPCPVIPRAEILAELMRMKQGIAVAGTHGKTTTTSMISTVLTHAGLDPTIVIGGRCAIRPGLQGTLAQTPLIGETMPIPATPSSDYSIKYGVPVISEINARLGHGDFLVAEADESDGSFLKLSPTIAVVTTLDEEHMEFYGSLERLKAAFLDFINKVPFYGAAVLCLDQENILDLLPGIQRRYITYGLIGSSRAAGGESACSSSGSRSACRSPRAARNAWGSRQADFTATAIESAGLRSSFEVIRKGQNIGSASTGACAQAISLGRIILNVPGLHNIYNALAATAVAMELDVPFDTIRDSLASFQGVNRRFQIKAHINNMYVVDDYGHHPTEIKATLATAKVVLATEGTPGNTAKTIPATPSLNHPIKYGVPGIGGIGRRLIVIFQPHRYTRTRDLLTEFYTAFNQSDVLIITDIYAAGEDPIEGIHARIMVEGVRQQGHHREAHYIQDREEIPARVLDLARPADMILTLGAGDIWKINQKIVAMVKERFS